MTDTDVEIETRWKALLDAEVDGDLETSVSFYADDVVLQPYNHPPVHGKVAARAYLERLLQTQPVSAMEPRNVRVIVSESGDIAANCGDLRVASVDSDEETFIKSIVVWQKDGTGWKVVLNSWSTNE